MSIRKDWLEDKKEPRPSGETFVSQWNNDPSPKLGVWVLFHCARCRNQTTRFIHCLSHNLESKLCDACIPPKEMRDVVEIFLEACDV